MDRRSISEHSFCWLASKTKGVVFSDQFSSVCRFASCFFVYLVDLPFEFFVYKFRVFEVISIFITIMNVHVIDYSIASEKGYLIRVGTHLSDVSNFSLDHQHFVPIVFLVKFVQQENLLALKSHSVAYKDV